MIETNPIPHVQVHNLLIPFVVTAGFIALLSLATESNRRPLNAIIVAVAAGAYLNGGFGILEFPFAIVVGYCAYQGLQSYRLIGIGWLLHTGWDILHHYTGHPMIGWLPTSSVECAISDTLLAIWFFYGAPSVGSLRKRGQPPLAR